MNGKRMNKSVAQLFQVGAVVAAFVVLLPNVVRAERPEFRGAVRAEKDITCDGDLDGDRQVGPADLAILLGGYGYCRSCPEDLDGDRRVDDRDLDILVANWGHCAVEPNRSTAALAPRNEIEADYSDGIVEEPEAPDGIESCSADLDEDGEVGPGDLAIVLAGFGYCRNCAEDLNGDRRVDEIDVDVLMESWGICPSSFSEIRDFCEGDFDEDGDVGSADLAMLLGRYGQRDRTVDLNGDNFIDDTDVDILMANWGPCE